MATRLLGCAVMFTLGAHLSEGIGLIQMGDIPTDSGAARQRLGNDGGGNALNAPPLLSLSVRQGTLGAGNLYGPRWDQDGVVNGTVAWASCPLVQQMMPLAANGLFEATAGSTARFRIKVQTNHPVDRLEKGDNVTVHIVPVAPASPREERCEGYVGTVRGNFDGTHDVSYEADVAGTYVVQARIGGQRVQHCPDSLLAPTGFAGHVDCSFDDPVLTVVSAEIDAARSAVLENTGHDDLAAPTPIGTTTKFSIIARDAFGNRRIGGSTPTFAGHGDGSSDVFVATLFDNEGHSVQTSSAVQTISAAVDADDSVDRSFRLEFGGATSRQLSTSASAEEVEDSLMGIFGHGDTVNVVVAESTVPFAGGGVAWRATFLSHFEEWSRSPLRVVPAVGDNRTVVSVRKEASEGVYPIEYTLRYPGRYGMSITDVRGEVGTLVA